MSRPANSHIHIHAPDDVVADVLSSANYKHVCPDLIKTVAIQELAKRRTYKETLKAVKNKLHQVGGAYLDERDDYYAWLPMLRDAVASGEQDELRRCCEQVMRHHVSTRERLPILDQFYTTLFADIGPVHSILDLACGLHPLALPWLSSTLHNSDIRYYAYDIYQHVMNFLDEWFALLAIESRVGVCDLSQHCPPHQVDVAFLLKTLPCLEQVEKAASSRLLRSVNARYLVVSFPAQSLGGRQKGMVSHYEAHFRELIAGEPWTVQKVVFETELVFVVKKG